MLLNIKSSKYATVWSFCFVEIRNHMQKYISSSVDSINPLAWRSPLMTFTLIQMFFDSVPQRSLCKHHTFISPAVQQRSHLFFSFRMIKYFRIWNKCSRCVGSHTPEHFYEWLQGVQKCWHAAYQCSCGILERWENGKRIKRGQWLNFRL